MTNYEDKDLKIRYNNAVADAEYYKDLYQELVSSKTIGKRIGVFIDKVNKKLSKIKRKANSKKKYEEAILFNKNGLYNGEEREKKVIVSLTSYPARIEKVPGTIGSLLNQTIKPDKIILWLGKEKFPNEILPDVYNQIRACGVDIRFRPDLKSHTKYFYAIQEFPDDIIITVDDDLIYHNTLVQELYDSYLKNPESVSALRVHKIRFDENGEFLPYAKWVYEYAGQVGEASHRFFATGVGGVLYPPHCLHEEVLNLEVIKKYCHNHDDLWLKVMEVMQGTRVVLASDSKLQRKVDVLINDTQTTGQWRENVMEGGDDRQTKAVLGVYNNFGEVPLTQTIALDT